MLQRGLHVNTHMLYPCVRSRAAWHIQDPLSLLVQRLGGWLSIRVDSVLYWVPETHTYMLYLLDPQLEREDHLDYIDHL